MLIVLLVLLVAAIAALAFVLMTRGRGVPGDGGGVLRGIEVQQAALTERVGAVAERLGSLERQQQGLGEGLQRLDTSLAGTRAVTGGIQQAAETIRGQLKAASEGLAALQAQASARQELEAQTAVAIRRLEQVIAGTSAKGTAGENLVEQVFAKLPPEWQERDFRTNNHTCEFGLRAPNGLVLPIDSKWPATQLLEQFLAAGDVAEQQRLKAQIERAVLEKAREVQKYLDPERTLGFGVAVVPDAVFELCTSAQAEAMALGVVIVSYGMFVPYLLLVFQTVLRTSRDIDVEKLAACLQAAEGHVAALEAEVDGRLSRAIVMLENSRDALRSEGSRLSGNLAALRAFAPEEAGALAAPQPAGTVGEGL